MSLEIHAPKADALARELAAATGEDIDTAVMRAVRGLARTPRSGLVRAAPAVAGPRSLGSSRAGIEQLMPLLKRTEGKRSAAIDALQLVQLPDRAN